MSNAVHNTIVLCLESSSNTSSISPLSTKEFYDLLNAIDEYNAPKRMDLFDFSEKEKIKFDVINELDKKFMVEKLRIKEELADKILTLFKRSTSVSFEIEKLENNGIKICTIFDPEYPKRLKSGLKNMPNSLREPPLFYYCGDISLLKLKYAGFVGAREVDSSDTEWTISLIKQKKWMENLGVVSGGSEGIDSISESTALSENLPVIEFSKNMRLSLKNPNIIDAIENKLMLLISEINPLRTLTKMDATVHFMNRNKYIYAISEHTFVVKSGFGSRSGTWSGAEQAIKKKITKVYVRDIPYEGNLKLIELGGIPYK